MPSPPWVRKLYIQEQYKTSELLTAMPKKSIQPINFNGLWISWGSELRPLPTAALGQKIQPLRRRWLGRVPDDQMRLDAGHAAARLLRFMRRGGNELRGGEAGHVADGESDGGQGGG